MTSETTTLLSGSFMETSAKNQTPFLQLRDGMAGCLGRMETGLPTTIVFLGGSITAHDGWRVQTEQWFNDSFPHTPFNMVNAGFGGTGSSLAVFRLERDVLIHRPDLVFVEFAVNDMDHPDHDLTLRSMESVIRRLRRDRPEADVCLVYTVGQRMLRLMEAGQTPPTIAIMERLATHYGLPSVNFAAAVLASYQHGGFYFHESERAESPERNLPVFTTDYTHPTEFGHTFYATVLAAALSQARHTSSPTRRDLPPPIHAALWLDGTMLPWDQLELSADWSEVSEISLSVPIHNRIKLGGLWFTRTPGAQATLSFVGDAVGFFGVFGRESGILDWSVDDGEAVTLPLFDQYGHMFRAHYRLIFPDLARTKHTLRVMLSPKHPERAAMLALKNKASEAATFPAGVLCCASALLINGTVC